MEDNILNSFLEKQWRDAMALNEASNIVYLHPLEGKLSQHYVVRFSCKGLVKTGNDVSTTDNFLCGIWLPDEYLRTVHPPDILTWLSPANIFHPNIRPPGVCIGRIIPGTEVVDLVYRVWALIVGENFTPREDDALNTEACGWWRNRMEMFPLDNRPLKPGNSACGSKRR